MNWLKGVETKGISPELPERMVPSISLEVYARSSDAFRLLEQSFNSSINAIAMSVVMHMSKGWEI